MGILQLLLMLKAGLTPLIVEPGGYFFGKPFSFSKFLRFPVG